MTDGDELARLDVELDRVIWLARTGRVDYDDALSVLEDHYERAVERRQRQGDREDDSSPPAPDRTPERERLAARERRRKESGRARRSRLGLDR